MGGMTGAGFVMSGHGDPTQVVGQRATSTLLDVFRVQPILGRWFSEAEDQPGGRKVVVISHGFWTRTFNGDRGVLGRTVTFDGEPYEIIGVMPETFLNRRIEAYVPLARTLDPGHAGIALHAGLRTAEAGDHHRPRRDRDARVGAVAGGGVRPQPRCRRAARIAKWSSVPSARSCGCCSALSSRSC